ncbi:MAG: TatD family hydrolase [Planctomycetota bacterium JB042]
MNDSSFPLVDTHCHLTWESFDDDLDDVVRRMREASVAQAVVVATDPATARRARAICADRPGLFAAAGVHPNDVPDDWERAVDEIASLLDEGGFVAVGETGLDDYRDHVPSERQRRSFDAHARLAVERDLPLIVHIRDRADRWVAYDDVAEILERHAGLRGVIHCYTGDVAHAERYRAAGFHISFSGILTFPNGGNVREVAAATPLDRTLVETDAPFLAPLPWRGKRNEPSYVAATARRLAELKGVEEEEVRRVTTANARRLFGLPG